MHLRKAPRCRRFGAALGLRARQEQMPSAAALDDNAVGTDRLDLTREAQARRDPEVASPPATPGRCYSQSPGRYGSRCFPTETRPQVGREQVTIGGGDDADAYCIACLDVPDHRSAHFADLVVVVVAKTSTRLIVYSDFSPGASPGLRVPDMQGCSDGTHGEVDSPTASVILPT